MRWAVSVSRRIVCYHFELADDYVHGGGGPAGRSDSLGCRLMRSDRPMGIHRLGHLKSENGKSELGDCQKKTV